MKFKVVKLYPKGPFRNIPRSTTLFGALANAVAYLYGEDEISAFIKGFSEARISSLFPFSQETYFLPKPLTFDINLAKLARRYLKGECGSKCFKDRERNRALIELKKIKGKKFVPLEYFEKTINGEEVSIKKYPEPYRLVEVPKVSLDRVTANSSIYFWDGIAFKENSGLYFLYKGSKEFFEKYIVPAISFLGDHGIGGKATWGYGLFRAEIDELEIRTPSGDSFVTLSLTYPSNPASLKYWKIEKVGGWTLGKRKPKIPFVVEGSILDEDPGKMIELNLGRKIYVYGLSFLIPTKIL
ncbi:type III-A CRISPR-associated RAMP protein Csm4 [Pyrococcus sp. ST04]|uniref:type III-A CRISPR-associated RAMP protein Csm4 n=1 Tax=Pyrococcus sp. ST04 TaxID=1183377 RepID=UPI000260591C|nr:type III-A CRISPR-associated RAMP protein Csm4 [Pyrococcus sp. ST04]AFK21709.1 putative CRISPR-associated RAMP protein, Csm4 family [Pyrococcus sp. ST04]